MTDTSHFISDDQIFERSKEVRFFVFPSFLEKLFLRFQFFSNKSNK